MSTEADVIHIVPRVVGAGGNGTLQTILGAVMVVVGVIMMYTPAAAYAPSVIGAGIGMMVGGVAMMLMPKLIILKTRTKMATVPIKALAVRSQQLLRATQYQFYMDNVKSVVSL